MVLDFAIVLLFSSAVAVGVVSAVVKTWTLRASLLELEDRVGVLEGVTTREVKIRAANSRKGLIDESAKLLQELKTVEEPPKRRHNWWEISLPRSVPK